MISKFDEGSNIEHAFAVRACIFVQVFFGPDENAARTANACSIFEPSSNLENILIICDVTFL